jgi:hypothetical protein
MVLVSKIALGVLLIVILTVEMMAGWTSSAFRSGRAIFRTKPFARFRRTLSFAQGLSSFAKQFNQFTASNLLALIFCRFIPLVRDEAAWRDTYRDEAEAESTLPTGTLQVYTKRGWCRLEILAALAPKKFWRGDWRPGPRNIRFRYHVSCIVVAIVVVGINQLAFQRD